MLLTNWHKVEIIVTLLGPDNLLEQLTELRKTVYNWFITKGIAQEQPDGRDA